MKFITKLVLSLPLLLIIIYQKCVSPLFPGKCGFTPTCSEYTKQAILRHGFKGLWLGFRRIIRCHPWTRGGYDPVP